MPALKSDFAETTDSRLSLFCAGLMEAAWLAAICVVPIILNPQSPHSAYQPFKVGFLRLFALIGGAAWLVRVIDLRINPATSLRVLVRSPISIFVFLFAIAVLISSALSIFPGASFWGSPETFQGALTVGAEIILFALIACNLRTREQIDRFITTLLMTSFVISIFAIVQRLGYDPRYPTIPGNRALSTAGHPIYLAGYLLMTMPLSIYRLHFQWMGKADGKILTRLFYGVVLAAQLIAFLCAESRGPILAMTVTLVALAIFYATHRRSRRTILVLTIAVAAIVIAISSVGLNNLRFVPGLARFARTTSLKSGVEFFRAELWKQAPAIIFAKEPLPHPTGGEDRHYQLRPWIGYGPETLECVLPRHYQIYDPDTNVIENRFHDLVWDTWFSVGALGLLMFLGIVTTLFFGTYRRLGLISSRKESATFWLILILACAVVSLSFTRFFGPGFFGVGLLGGLVAGFLLFASVATFKSSANGLPAHGEFLPFALLAALAGHLIDMAFAFPTATTSVLFWSVAGLVVSLVRADKEAPAARGNPKKRSDAGSRDQLPLLDAAIVTLGLVTFSISAIHQYSFQPMSLSGVFVGSLLDLSGNDGRQSLLLIPLAVFWLSASYALAHDRTADLSVAKTTKLNIRTLTISGGVGFAYALWRSGQVATIGPIPSIAVPESSVLDQARGYELLFGTGALVIFVLMPAIAFGLSRMSQAPVRSTSNSSLVAAGIAFVTAIVLCWIVAITPLRAAVNLAWAETLDETGRLNASAAVYRRVVDLSPRPYLYRAMMSEVLIKQGSASSENADAESLFTEAESLLLGARAVSDLNRSSLYLGQLYLIWAEHEKGSARNSLIDKALAASREAQIFEPNADPVKDLRSKIEKMTAERPR